MQCIGNRTQRKANFRNYVKEKQLTDHRLKEVERLLSHKPSRKFKYNNPIEELKNRHVTFMD